MKPVRPLRIIGNLAFIPLTKGYEAIIDAADAHLVDKWNWVVVLKKFNGKYAYRSIGPRGKQKTIYLHRVIMNASDGIEVDHIDFNGLNNRRNNLRLATHQQNLCNRSMSSTNKSGFRGVSWAKDRQKWRAQITVNCKMKYLGTFSSPEIAHAAYLEASKHLHGSFGASNIYRETWERATWQKKIEG